MIKFDFDAKGRKVLTADSMPKLLNYSPDSGLFWWKAREPKMFLPSGKGLRKTPEEMCDLWNMRFAGKPAFKTTSKTGYKVAVVFNRQYKAHRVAFAIMMGRWPLNVDHINRQGTDNRWENIREATMSQNCANRLSGRRKKTSKFKGVSARDGAWLARCRGKDIGVFTSEHEAAIAYNSAAVSIWGKYAIVNKVSA